MPPRRPSSAAPSHNATDLARWRNATMDMSDSCERVFDVARGFALGRGSDAVRVEHFVWALFHNGRHASTASFLSFAADVDVPKLLRLVQAACHVYQDVAPQDAGLTPKLLEAVSVARDVCLSSPEAADEGEPRIAAQSVLAVLLLDANNFAARALREALPGERGARTPVFHRLRASLLAAFGIIDEDQSRRISRSLRAAQDAEDTVDTPEEYTCPISGEVMSDPVTTAMGQTYERPNIERWLRDHVTDPLTNARLTTRTLTPNHALRSLITKWQEVRDQANIPPATPNDPALTPTSTPQRR